MAKFIRCLLCILFLNFVFLQSEKEKSNFGDLWAAGEVVGWGHRTALG